jgi:hypothetical protein
MNEWIRGVEKVKQPYRKNDREQSVKKERSHLTKEDQQKDQERGGATTSK